MSITELLDRSSYFYARIQLRSALNIAQHDEIDAYISSMFNHDLCI